MKIGEVVSLVSGGPSMTVVGVKTAPFGSKRISCIWFAKDKVAKGTFDAEILRSAASEGSAPDL